MIRYRDKLDAMASLGDDMRKIYDELYYEYATGPIVFDANDIIQCDSDIPDYLLDHLASITDELG